jgi:uncharacterized protein (TIGR00299 family) protein
MRTVYFDPVGGAAGDMLLGALIDLGAPLEAVRAALATLPVGGFELEARPVVVSGLRATRVEVRVDESGTHRGLSDLLAILGGSGLSPFARERAGNVFRRLASAEARVHGLPIEAVHFHEVGAIDAVVDIVGTVIALELLGVEAVRFGVLVPGTGVVETAHGPLPVPAPATLELLTGTPIRLGGPPGEWVTPTAAALLTTLGTPASSPSLAVARVGIGAGRRQRTDRPNVVRALLGEMAAESDDGTGRSTLTPSTETILREEVVVIETAIDDQTPAGLAHAVDHLRAAGAIDVFLTPVGMKKGRTGTLLTVLAQPAQGEALVRHILRETTTLGVRLRREERRVLRREILAVATPYGPVRMKETRRPPLDGAGSGGEGELLDAAPEASDVARAAAERGVPFAVVAAAARQAWEVARGRSSAESPGSASP